jgi:site-specific DNA-methyltransferase (adenine-specific)
VVEYGDTGTASRFFPQFPADDPDAPWSEALFRYVAKPSRAERNVGCAGLPEALSDATGFDGATVAHRIGEDGRITPKAVRGPQANHHPTVKPVALMRWLIRLVTKPGDVVLDPFGGSGTTGVAALLEGRRVVLVEREPAFAAIIRARCAAADGSDWTRPVVARPAALAARGVDSGRQLSLLDAMAGAR